LVERFLCAHAILLAIEGIPALYIHSLLATGNDHERVVATGHPRAINRHQWQLEELTERLDEPTSVQSKVFRGLLKLLSLRRRQPAFHPNATQFTLQLGDQVFGFWRQSQRRDQSIFCLNNLSHEPVSLALNDINLISTEPWHDILTGEAIEDASGQLELAPYQVVWLTNQTF
jgi:sucrose phosphorylase